MDKATGDTAMKTTLRHARGHAESHRVVALVLVFYAHSLTHLTRNNGEQRHS